jgi:polyadenylate-binding protein
MFLNIGKKTENEDDEKLQELKKNRNNDKLYVARAQKRTERSIILNRKNRRGGRSEFPASNQGLGSNLYVKNLTADVDDQKLHQMFSKFGEITSAKVMTDQSGRSRLFGFVAFKLREEATRALQEMQNSIVNGKRLYVARAQPKAIRQQYIFKQIRNKRPHYHPMSNYNNIRGVPYGAYNGPQS